MHDLIERQAAIDAHYEYCNKHPDSSFPVWSLKILEDLPPAQPDMSGYSDKLWKAAYERGKAEAQRTGRWIIKDNPGTGWYRVTCSECGEDVTSTAPCIGFYPNAKVTWDYCPNCGAEMLTEDKE